MVFPSSVNNRVIILVPLSDFFSGYILPAKQFQMFTLYVNAQQLDKSLLSLLFQIITVALQLGVIS